MMIARNVIEGDRIGVHKIGPGFAVDEDIGDLFLGVGWSPGDRAT